MRRRAAAGAGAHRVRERHARADAMTPVWRWLAIGSALGAADGLRHLRRLRPGAAVAGPRRHACLDGSGGRAHGRRRQCLATPVDRRGAHVARPRLSADRAALRPGQVVQRRRRVRRRQPALALSGSQRLCIAALHDGLPLADRALQSADRGHPQRRHPNRSVLQLGALRSRYGSQAREGARLCHQPVGGGARQYGAAHRREPQHRALGAGLAVGARRSPTRSRWSGW